MVAEAGAFSLKSRLNFSPSGITATKNPPPPRLPFDEEVTESAKPIATAASIALPPFFKTSIPISDASLLVQTTMPFSPNTGSELAASILLSVKKNVKKTIIKFLNNFNIYLIVSYRRLDWLILWYR